MFRQVITMLSLLACTTAWATEEFPLQQVRLLDGPFRHAQDLDVAYILSLDPQRLLAPYLVEAGLEAGAERYGNWESDGLGGHIGGHYLSALSLAWAATGRQDLLDRLDMMLAELRRAQEANANGYLGGVPGGREFWTGVAGGDIRADPFGLNGVWVPWYNLHKVFAGLRDAWLVAQRPLARTMLVDWANWAVALLDGLSDEQLQSMLTAEHGGMNEVFADVYAITGDARYLDAARRFSHRALLDPLLRGEDPLTGLHANTQIPKVTGFERIAAVGGFEGGHRAAQAFWDNVVQRRTVVIGGNSVREHFHAVDDFSTMLADVQGPETCNTYNMLRLARMLYARDPRPVYVDYMERALYNHILASQDPDTGGLVYFTPMRPGHYRVYSQAQQAMWCCVGSGMENHVQYGRFIYAREGDALIVNLFIASRLEWPERGLVLRQETSFPDRDETRIVFESDARLALKLRYPSWAVARPPVLSLNGAPLAAEVGPNGTIRLERDWRRGDTLVMALASQVRQESLPDGSGWVALLYGPVALAAAVDPFPGESLNFFADDSRMGHVPDGATCPTEALPAFPAGVGELAARVERLPQEPLRFRSGLIELQPFFRLHRARYVLYWPPIKG